MQPCKLLQQIMIAAAISLTSLPTLAASSFATNSFSINEIKHTVQPFTSHTIQYQAQVKTLLAQLNPQNMWDDLTILSSFNDRYANSPSGIAAANWIINRVETFVNNNLRDDVTIDLVQSGNKYKQPSVVVKIGNADEPGVVISAHIDTPRAINNYNMPGADDDGSGCVTVLETLRVILASDIRFKKPLYFIWYAAEEEGLVGSSNVVESFKNNNVPIDGVLQLDLTGYAPRNEPTMWIIDDYVDNNLATYLETLIQTYIKQPTNHTKCGYACSDHASWVKAGYPAAIATESAFQEINRYKHHSQDTINHLSLSHMTDYLKLATAFAVELAEPLSNKS